MIARYLIDGVALGLALACFGVVALTGAVGAQETGSADQNSKANYAFAAQVGSGIYRFSNGSVQVYRLGGGFNLRSLPSDAWGLRIQVLATAGFYSFESGEAHDSGLPDRLGTLSLVPEVRFELPVTGNWRVMPFAAAGVGRDFSADRFSFILAGGSRSLATFDIGPLDLHVGNRLFYAGYATTGSGDDFGGLDSGLDVRHPLGISLAGRGLDVGLFGINYLYLFSPELFRFDPQPLSINVQWEFGFTVGTMSPLRVLGFELPRIGLSRRVGSGVSTFRIVFGGPFT